MKKLFILIISTAALAGCSKEVLKTTGLLRAERIVSEEEGSFPAIVSCACAWKAESGADWIEVDGRWRKGESTLQIHYASNESVEGDRRFNRIGDIYIRTYDNGVADTIRIKQHGLVPSIVFPKKTVSAGSGTVRVPFSTNLTDRERGMLTFSADASWIGSCRWSSDQAAVEFKCDGGSGSATLTATFTDAWGLQTSADCTITKGGE